VAATEVWTAALSSRWDRPPVWVHGDVAVGNLLATEGRLSAVIDFGTCGVGDPACDLVIAWTLFADDSRQAFKQAVDLDPQTWDRARGWALWKALITLARPTAHNPPGTPPPEQVLDAILADHRIAHARAAAT
jgi:aminoglycoside phosphotransferase (APT) family kinase protein